MKKNGAFIKGKHYSCFIFNFMPFKSERFVNRNTSKKLFKIFLRHSENAVFLSIGAERT